MTHQENETKEIAPDWAIRLEAKIDQLRLDAGLIDRAREIVGFWIDRDGKVRDRSVWPQP